MILAPGKFCAGIGAEGEWNRKPARRFVTWVTTAARWRFLWGDAGGAALSARFSGAHEIWRTGK